jgi:6-pyruvoyltetrahydropterin/6-carboxytetrahydropterin synthase
MDKIRITKKFRFEMSHILWNYDGLCKNIHGHSYILYVTILGNPHINKESNLGMVMDFKELKKIVNEEIINKFDHSIVVNSQMPSSKIAELKKITSRCVVVDYQPTCENILIDFVMKIRQRLPENVKLHSLKLNETSDSYAEWYASDNEQLIIEKPSVNQLIITHN